MAGSWIKGVVLSVDSGKVVLQVEQVLSGTLSATQVKGNYTGEVLCGGGVCLRLTVGDEVLANYQLQQGQCSEREICISENCQNTHSVPSADCQEDCAEQASEWCETNTTPVAWLGIALWDEELVLARTPSEVLSISSEHVDILWNAQLCDSLVEDAHLLSDYPLLGPAERECQPDEKQ